MLGDFIRGVIYGILAILAFNLTGGSTLALLGVAGVLSYVGMVAITRRELMNQTNQRLHLYVMFAGEVITLLLLFKTAF